MNKIICFIDKKESYSGELKEYIMELDKAGYLIYLNTDIILQEGDPVDILYNLDILEEKTQSENQFIFLSNMYDLTQFVYRVYHQAFNNFIYYYQEHALNYPLSAIFKDILDLSVTNAENLHKVIYTNLPQFAILHYKCKIAALHLFLGDNLDNNLNSNQLIAINDEITCKTSSQDKLRKLFYVKGSYYFFEPFITNNYIIVSELSADSKQYKENIYPGFLEINYYYPYNVEIISRLITFTEDLNYQSLVEIYDILDTLEQELNSCHTYSYNMTCSILDDISLYHTGKDILRALLLLSFLMQVTKKPVYLNRFLEYIIDSDILSYENRFYLWNQAKRYILTSRACGDIKTDELMKRLYKKTYYEYKTELENVLTPISVKERNRDTIVVFSIQFLSDRHAPTRTTLERCYTLSKLLGKNVVLFNTREQLTSRGMLPLYMSTLGNVMDEYTTIQNYTYKDCEIPYYQPDDNMPSIEGIKNIIHKIRQLKPSFIFSIGNGSITADLCGNIVPQASIGVAFSLLPTTMATFSVIGKTLSELEWENYLKKGYSRESIIESTFTFELLPKKMSFTRKEFGIPENDFVLVTIGIRLDTEIDDTYIKNIITTFKWGTHIVFAGYFDRYASYCEKYPELKEHSTFIGYCNDILALMEICDLYVNPKRLGGGFSIIEAFHEGKPGVTIDYGDIATAAGKLFTVNDYQEMNEIIKKYMDDKEFYQRMSEEAIAREKILTDSASAMINIIDKIQNSPLFF